MNEDQTNHNIERIAVSLEKIEKTLDTKMVNVEREQYGYIQTVESMESHGWWNDLITFVAVFILGIVVGCMLFQLGIELLR